MNVKNEVKQVKELKKKVAFLNYCDCLGVIFMGITCDIQIILKNEFLSNEEKIVEIERCFKKGRRKITALKNKYPNELIFI